MPTYTRQELLDIGAACTQPSAAAARLPAPFLAGSTMVATHRSKSDGERRGRGGMPEEHRDRFFLQREEKERQMMQGQWRRQEHEPPPATKALPTFQARPSPGKIIGNAAATAAGAAEPKPAESRRGGKAARAHQPPPHTASEDNHRAPIADPGGLRGSNRNRWQDPPGTEAGAGGLLRGTELGSRAGVAAAAHAVATGGDRRAVSLAPAPAPGYVDVGGARAVAGAGLFAERPPPSGFYGQLAAPGSYQGASAEPQQWQGMPDVHYPSQPTRVLERSTEVSAAPGSGGAQLTASVASFFHAAAQGTALRAPPQVPAPAPAPAQVPRHHAGAPPPSASQPIAGGGAALLAKLNGGGGGLGLEGASVPTPKNAVEVSQLAGENGAKRMSATDFFNLVGSKDR
jgi:hypothetical protein